MKLVARASLIVSLFFGLDKVLAFIRQLIVTRQFSLSYQLDVFNASNNIPDLLSALISGGALGVALIPVLSEYMERKGRPAAWDVFSRIINLAFLVTAGIALITALFAPWLVNQIIVPGFPIEQKILTAKLMRLDLLAILIFSISGLVMAGLQANQHFFLPALAPILYNIGQIFGAAILAPKVGMQLGPITLPAFGLGLYGLVYGVILGALLHLAIQIPGLIKYQFKWKPVIGLKDAGVQQVLRLLGPRVLTMFFLQIFFIARDNLASGLGEGSVTAINLGWFIMQVPETLIGTAVAVALLPTISEMFARNEKENFSKTINASIRLISALTIPVAALIAIGIRPLIQTAFNFTATDTERVVVITQIYLIGLIGHSLLEIASRSFYAQQNAKIPLYASAFNAICYVGFAIFLSRQFGPNGIAAANIISFSLEAVLLLWLLKLKFPDVLQSRDTFVRTIVGTLISSLVFYLLLKLNFSPLILSMVGMVGGFLIMIPFILPEIRLLFNLESSDLAQINLNS